MSQRSPIVHLRVVASAFLVAMAVFATCAAVVTHWVDAVLLDTDTFIAAIEPIIGDDAARGEASDAIASAVIDVIDVRALSNSALAGAESSLVDEIVTGFETFVGETVSSAVSTDTFERLWLTEMRLWHVKFVGAVKSSDAEYTPDGTAMRVTLGPYIDLLTEQAKSPLARLVIMALVPDAARNTRVVVFDTKLVENRLPLLRRLDATRPYLPWIAGLALLMALFAAPRTSGAVLGAGVALSTGGGVGWLLARAETTRVASLMQSTFSTSTESAASFARTLFGPLETWLGYLALAGIFVAALGAIAAFSQRASDQDD